MIDHARISDFHQPEVPDGKDLAIECLRDALLRIINMESCLLADAQEIARQAVKEVP